MWGVGYGVLRGQGAGCGVGVRGVGCARVKDAGCGKRDLGCGSGVQDMGYVDTGSGDAGAGM